MIDDKDAIINAFRPIEQLFSVMDRASDGADAGLSRSYAEVGIALCAMFRAKVEKLFSPDNGDKVRQCE